MESEARLHLMKKKMPRPFLLLFLFFFSTLSFGQKYYTKDILQKADSLMIAVVGYDVFHNHYRLDSNSYYQRAKTIVNNDKIRYLAKTKRTARKIKLIPVRYTFHLSKLEKPAASATILLDKALHLTHPIDTSYIPPFILLGTASDFLTREQVLQLAKDTFEKKGIKPVEASIAYDYDKKLYVWTVVNILHERKGYNDELSREVEWLEINASSGQIITHANALQGHLH